MAAHDPYKGSPVGGSRGAGAKTGRAKSGSNVRRAAGRRAGDTGSGEFATGASPSRGGQASRRNADQSEGGGQTVPLEDYQALQRQNRALARALDASHRKILYLERQIGDSPYAMEVRKTLSRKKYRYGELPGADVSSPDTPGTRNAQGATPSQKAVSGRQPQSQLQQSSGARTTQDQRALEDQAEQISTLQMVNAELKKIIKKKDAQLEQAYALIEDSRKASLLKTARRDLQFYKRLCEENGLIGEASEGQGQVSLRTGTGIVVKGSTGVRSPARPVEDQEAEDGWDAGYTDTIPVSTGRGYGDASGVERDGSIASAARSHGNDFSQPDEEGNAEGVDDFDGSDEDAGASEASEDGRAHRRSDGPDVASSGGPVGPSGIMFGSEDPRGGGADGGGRGGNGSLKSARSTGSARRSGGGSSSGRGPGYGGGLAAEPDLALEAESEQGEAGVRRGSAGNSAVGSARSSKASNVYDFNEDSPNDSPRHSRGGPSEAIGEHQPDSWEANSGSARSGRSGEPSDSQPVSGTLLGSANAGRDSWDAGATLGLARPEDSEGAYRQSVGGASQEEHGSPAAAPAPGTDFVIDYGEGAEEMEGSSSRGSQEPRGSTGSVRGATIGGMFGDLAGSAASVKSDRNTKSETDNNDQLGTRLGSSPEQRPADALEVPGPEAAQSLSFTDDGGLGGGHARGSGGNLGADSFDASSRGSREAGGRAESDYGFDPESGSRQDPDADPSADPFTSSAYNHSGRRSAGFESPDYAGFRRDPGFGSEGQGQSEESREGGSLGGGSGAGDSRAGGGEPPAVADDYDDLTL